MTGHAAQPGTLDGSLADASAPEGAASTSDRGGVVLGDFLLGEKRGQGAMGVVYAARDLRDDRPVALKVLPGSLLADLARARRFAAEAEVLASLDHPAIVRHVAHGLTPRGEPFLAMEWLDGEDLAQQLQRRGLGLGEVVTLGRRVAEGLAAAHARGVIHRDIKPSNLFLRGGEAERAAILDFGVAHVDEAQLTLTATGAVIGTPGYMAPEQARGAASIDARADLFSLGAVLYECLTGRPPFTGQHVVAVLAKVLLEDPPPLASLRPDVPRALDALITRLLAKDPAARPADAATVAAALAAISLDEGSGASPAPLRAPDDGALTDSEQRFLCVVIAGAPRNAAAHGAASASTLSASSADLHPTLSAVAAPLGAEVVRLLDGSVLAVARRSGSAADQATRAARCALAFQPLLPEASIAVATGLGDASAPVPVGPVLDRAAALLEAGRAGAWIDELTAGLLDARFVVQQTPEGRALLHERSAGEGARLLLGRPSPCVGRERELRVVADVLDECINEGVARAVLVKAPAGAGKSRFLGELLAAASHRDRAPRVWLGRGDMLSAGSAFALLASALRHALGLHEGDALDLRRRRIHERVAAGVPIKDRARVAAFLGELTGTPFPDDDLPLLRSARRDPAILGEQLRRAFEDFVAAECAAQPVLLALEDVHWGDQPSFKLIDAALGKLRDRPLLVVAAGRPEVDELFPRLWAERGVQELRLAELTRRAAERLVRHALGEGTPAETVRRIVERAAGNAFYLEELIRAVFEGRGEDLPETVLAMVQARLDALDAEDRRLLRAASVFGETFWVGGVSAMLGGAEGAPLARARLDALVEQEVFVRREESRFPGEDELGFRHALLRDGAHATLTDHDRRVGHRLAGHWLEERGERDPLVLAEHFDRGGEPRLAAAQYLRAAEMAVSGGDFAVIARAERGLACGAEGELRSSLVLILGRARWMTGDLAGSEALRDEFMRTASPSHPGYPIVLTGLLIMSLHRGDASGLRLAVAGARTMEPSAANVSLLAELHWALLGRVPHLWDDDLQARALRLPALVSPQDHVSAGYLAGARGQLAALFDGDLERGAALDREAAEHLETAGSVVNAARIRSVVGTITGLLGAYERAAQEHALALAQTGGVGMQWSLVRMARTFTLLERGALDEARGEAELLVAESVRAADPGRESRSRQLLAQALLLGGELDAAAREAEASLALPWIFSSQRPETLGLLSAIRRAQGRSTEALDAAREALGPDDPPRIRLLQEPSLRLALVEALDAAGERAASLDALAVARARLREAAGKIHDAELRQSFLARVADNARTLRLAEERLGPA